MRLRRHGARAPEEGTHGIDLAPMLDFVLNLLIFFIITAVFVKEYGMQVTRPGSASVAEAVGRGSIVVRVLGEGVIEIDGRAVDVRAVRANVERLHSANPQSGALILSDGNAATGLVVKVADQIRQAGVYDVTFGSTDL